MTELPGNHPGDLLAEFAELLALESDAWAEGESCDVAEIGELAVSPALLDDTFFSTLDKLHRRFGASLRFKLEATPVQYICAPDLADASRVSEFRAELEEVAGEVTVWFRLDKSAWLNSKLDGSNGEGSDSRVCWFVSGKTIERLLTLELPEVERRLFAAERRVVLLTPEPGMCLVGEHLTIRTWEPGATRLGPAAPVISCDQMRRRVRWQQPYLEVVTPFHFALEGDDPSGGLSADLARLFLSAFALFTADMTNGAKTLHSSYVGATGTVEFDHGIVESAPLHQPSVAQAVAHLTELLEWIYCEERLVTDRLAYAQTLLVSELQQFSIEQRWSALVRLAERVKTLTIRRWKTFIEDKLHAHEDVVREHVGAVESAADRYQDEVGELVRSLSGAAVGGATVFVGTWIAMIGKIDVNAEFLRVVVAVYAVYLAAFPLVLKSLAARNQAALIDRKFTKRRERVAAILGDSEVDEIEKGVIEPAQRLFERWWAASVAVNIVLIAASVAAVYWAPELLGQKVDQPPVERPVEAKSNEGPRAASNDASVSGGSDAGASDPETADPKTADPGTADPETADPGTSARYEHD